MADIFLDRLGLPDWTFFGLLGVLVVGLPVVVATAWVQARPKSRLLEVDAEGLGRGRSFLEASDRILGDTRVYGQVAQHQAITRAFLRFLDGDEAGAVREAQRFVAANP